MVWWHVNEPVTVYQKPTCTTCKSLMMLLKDKGISFDAINYFIDPIPRDRLIELLGKMRASPRDIVRTKEPEYLALGLADATDDEILDALITHPQLLQRPIVEIGDRAVLARPAERVNEIL
jgi:arsenate reductase